MAVPSTVVYFTCYDQMKYRLGFVDGEANSLIIPFLSGSLARGMPLSAFISYHPNSSMASVIIAIRIA